MPASRATTSKLSLLAVLAVLLAIAGGLMWRAKGRVELEGKLREGSLRCDDECHFELVVEGQPETRVRVDTCIMPDTLRDWPGVPLHLMVAGKWEGERRLHASALLTQEGYRQGPKSSSGRPPSCFIPGEQR